LPANRFWTVLKRLPETGWMAITKKEILKEFDKYYVYKNGTYRHEPEILRQFISEALDKVKREVVIKNRARCSD